MGNREERRREAIAWVAMLVLAVVALGLVAWAVAAPH